MGEIAKQYVRESDKYAEIEAWCERARKIAGTLPMTTEHIALATNLVSALAIVGSLKDKANG